MFNDDTFFDNVYKTLGCWEWIGKKGGKYGVYEGELAHAYSWRMHKGETSRYVCHRCDNCLCVNPSHLYLSDTFVETEEWKMREAKRRGGKWKLTEHDIINIRNMLANGVTKTDLSKVYKVSMTTLQRNLKRVPD
jgi:hypothetical protein